MQFGRKRQLEKKDVIGRFIHYSVLIIPSLVILYSFFFSVGGVGIYNIVRYGTRSVHGLSLVTLCSSFIIHYLWMKHIMPLARFVIAFSFILFYINLGGMFWMINSYLYRGTGIIMPSVLRFVAIIILIILLDKTHNILDYSIFSSHNFSILPFLFICSLFSCQFIGYLGLGITGFWDKMVLYDLGTLIGDPNLNIFWVLVKVTSSWFILPLIKQSNYKAPLRLDPKVLIW